MKKPIVLLIILIIAVGPLFQGLFFPFEMYVSFSFLTILCAVYFGIKAVKREQLFLKSPPVYLGVFLLFAYVLSFFTAVNPRGNIETILQYTVYYLVFLIVFDYFKKNISDIPLFIIIPFLAVGFIAALIGLAGYTNVFSFLADTTDANRIGSTLQYANTAAIYFLIVVICTMMFILTSRNLYIKSILVGAGNIVFMALFFTSSRGVFLIVPLIAFLIFILLTPKGSKFQSTVYLLCITFPILIAVKGYDNSSKALSIESASGWLLLSASLSVFCAFIIGVLYNLKVDKKYKFAGMGIFSAAAVLAFILNSGKILNAFSVFLKNNIPGNIIERLSDINLHTESVFIRFELYKDALKLIKENWLFGLGGGGFASRYQGVQDIYYAARLVHNHYLQVFVEAGTLGIICFSALTLLSCFFLFYARIEAQDRAQKICITVCLCAFLSLALHSAIDFNLSYSAMSLIFWSFMGISAAYFFQSKSKTARPIPKTKTAAVPVFLSAGCFLLFVFTVCFAVSSHFASIGAEYKKKVEPTAAISAYKTAAMLDPLNANHHAELADLYGWMAYCSQTTREQGLWIEQAITEGQKAVRLDRYYPYYNSIMTNVYFQAGESIKAYEQAEFLISIQPHVSANYELLAQGYLEAGLQYIRDKNIEKAKLLLSQCTDIVKYPDVDLNQTIAFYQGKALLVLGSFYEAEKKLLYAREGSLELKMKSDRLLFIINEQTGRSAENSKYKGVIWMGMVRSTSEYREINDIINLNILKK